MLNLLKPKQFPFRRIYHENYNYCKVLHFCYYFLCKLQKDVVVAIMAIIDFSFYQNLQIDGIKNVIVNIYVFISLFAKKIFVGFKYVENVNLKTDGKV